MPVMFLRFDPNASTRYLRRSDDGVVTHIRTRESWLGKAWCDRPRSAWLI